MSYGSQKEITAQWVTQSSNVVTEAFTVPMMIIYIYYFCYSEEYRGKQSFGTNLLHYINIGNIIRTTAAMLSIDKPFEETLDHGY